MFSADQKAVKLGLPRLYFVDDKEGLCNQIHNLANGDALMLVVSLITGFNPDVTLEMTNVDRIYVELQLSNIFRNGYSTDYPID